MRRCVYAWMRFNGSLSIHVTQKSKIAFSKPLKKCLADGSTDGPTDGLTDREMNGKTNRQNLFWPTSGRTDAGTHLKTSTPNPFHVIASTGS